MEINSKENEVITYNEHVKKKKKQGKIVFHFYNGSAKTYSYDLKISENTKFSIYFILKHVFIYITHLIQVT